VIGRIVDGFRRPGSSFADRLRASKGGTC